MDCPICCCHYTDYLRKRVECLHCKHSCCRVCVKQYILSTPFMPRCMSCLKEWNREFMYNSMTKRFVLETLKSHAEQLMLDRERALLPATQPIVERNKRIHDIYNKNSAINNNIFMKRREERDALHTLRKNRSELILNGHRMRTDDINFSETLTDSDQSDNERETIRRHHAKMPQQLREDIHRWKGIRQELRKLEGDRQANYVLTNRLRRMNQRRINALAEHIQGNANALEYATSGSEDEAGSSEGTAKKTRRAFVRSCPQQDCRGFLSTRWICGLCSAHVCPKCHEIKSGDSDQNHTCDPNNIATAEMLMKDTKGCPNCGTQIHKIDGCNMMFCTQCHTPFCWKTGEIIKNQRIHNPHYYEWLRQNSMNGTIPREPGDVVGNVCNERLSIRAIREKLIQHDLLSYDLEDTLWNIHRISIHIEMVEIPRLRITYEYPRDNTDLRIRYLSNDFTEIAWKHELYKRAKRKERNTNTRHILEMVSMVINNEFHKLLDITPLTFDHVIDCLTVFENVRTYANQQLFDVSRLYQCRVPKIEETTWRIGSQKAEQHTTRKRPLKNEANNDTHLEEAT